MNASRNASSRRQGPITVLVSMPVPSTGSGTSYTCHMIATSANDGSVRWQVFTPYGYETPTEWHCLTQTLPLSMRLLPFKYTRSKAYGINEAMFLKEAERVRSEANIIAYLWPDPSIKMVRALKDLGIPVIREMINCHRQIGRSIVDEEYRRLGLIPAHAISQESVELESKSLRYCDYIFCSNAMAERSIIEDGVPSSKIRSVSFGWEPGRFEGDSRGLPPIEATTYIFAGTICVRKGAHLLLQYWAKSGIRGRLILVGRIEPGIERLCAKYLNRDDVTVIGYRRDLGPLYRSADAFVFPSLEEGGPQVTYEACGNGLPVITSPMGAARIADASNGYVIDPFDEAGWIEAMRTLAADGDLRKRLGAAARHKAQEYTWEKVSIARQKVFAEASAHSSSDLSVGTQISAA